MTSHRSRTRNSTAKHMILRFSFIAAVATWVGTCAALSGSVTYTGVNLAGAEFTPSHLPGSYNIDYTYPTTAEVDYFVTRKGMNTIRLPFRWERLQRSLNGPFDVVEHGRFQSVVSDANVKGATVILDPHNYARYSNNLIGSPQVSIAAFSDFCSRLAN